MLEHYLLVFFIAMVPVVELRGAIPIGLGRAAGRVQRPVRRLMRIQSADIVRRNTERK